jgi:nucleoside-diphosphate-sugar epimerase
VHAVVTGGAGFIGSHLVDALLARAGTTVLVLDNLSRGRMSNLAHHEGDPRFELFLGDVREKGDVAKALEGASVVFHLGAQSNVMGAVSDPRYSFETNVVGTFNVLEAAAEARVKRVVFTSSREAYGESRMLPVAEDQPLDAKNTYGASKAAAEAYCRTFSNVFELETAILRLANVYGPRDFDRVIPLWITRALRGAPIVVFGGDQIIDFVWVGQVVDALLNAAEKRIGRPVNVASGVGTPIGDLAQRVLEGTNSASQLEVIPARPEEVRRFVADIRRMSCVLDITPAAEPLAHLPDVIESVRCELE